MYPFTHSKQVILVSFSSCSSLHQILTYKPLSEPASSLILSSKKHFTTSCGPAYQRSAHRLSTQVSQLHKYFFTFLPSFF
uniref:Uncharacterized protein n=1 Tax=Rhizophora mucronata TaxID=61149 RepID=A0A2P2NP03_RHIMU